MRKWDDMPKIKVIAWQLSRVGISLMVAKIGHTIWYISPEDHRHKTFFWIEEKTSLDGAAKSPHAVWTAL
jgi:hypothetical protein